MIAPSTTPSLRGPCSDSSNVVGSWVPIRSLAALTTLALAALVATGCGSSSQTETITAPSTNRCALQASADTPSFPAAGGSGSVRITTTRDCQWTAKSDSAWVTIAAPSQGQGEGSIKFSVGSNTDPASRTAGLTINDQRLDISQGGKPCEFTVSSNHESIDGAGGNLTVDVRASSTSCSWTASSTVSWISIVSGRDGRGNGTVSFHVDSMIGPARTGNLTIAGQNVQVDQGAACTYTIGADTFTVDAGGGDRQVAVTATASCSWTAQSQSPWITIIGGATGTGNGSVAFRVAPSDGTARSGALIVAGRTITVTQSLTCTYSITPPAFNVGAQAGTNTIQVDAGTGCSWTAASGVSWITIASGSGSGRGQVQFAVAANDGVARSGTITVAGQAVTVNQASGCTYSVQPTSQDVEGSGGNVTATVTTGSSCSWTASSSVDWMIPGSPSGTGAGQTIFTVKPNLSPPRTGNVSVASRSITVNQKSMCSWFFAPQSHDLPASGGTGNVLVFVTGGACSWTAVPNVPWIQITAGGSGTGGGLLQFIVLKNTGASRTGLIAIGGENYVVRQAAVDEP